MEILTYGNATLRKKAIPLDLNSQKEKDFIIKALEDMRETLYKKRARSCSSSSKHIKKIFYFGC